jgi:hypothetical protein
VPAVISAILGIGLTLHLLLSIREKTAGPSVTRLEDRWSLAGESFSARLRAK